MPGKTQFLFSSDKAQFHLVTEKISAVPCLKIKKHKPFYNHVSRAAF